MANQGGNKHSNKSGSFSFSGTGVVALVALIVLGGGAFAFVSLRNQNNPIFNVSGQGGQGGSAIGIQGQNSNPSQASSSSQSSQESASSSQTPDSANAKADVNNAKAIIDVNASDIKWSLKYPVFQKTDKSCVLGGYASVVIQQLKGGDLKYSGGLNVYQLSSIQGTITPSGQVNLNIASANGIYLITLEGQDVKSESPEMSITGKASMVGCPESTFKLVRVQ